MILELSGSGIAYVAVFVIAIILGLYTWKRRIRPGGRYFAWLMGAVAFWALMCITELIVLDAPISSGAITLEYLAVTWAGPLWLLFVLDYGYRDRWSVTRKTIWIWAIPALIMVLALTNQWHGLIWYRTPGDPVIFGHGIGLMVNLIYTYALLLGGFGLLIWAVVGSRKKNYLKAAMLVLGTMIPLATSLLYMVGLDPDLVGQITPFALAATIIVYAWSIFGLHLFDLVPVAREALVRSMADGVMVLDKGGEILDMNPSARRILDVGEAALGLPVEVALARWPPLVELCHSMKEGSSEILINRLEGPLWIELHVSSVHDARGKLYGRLVELRDITKHKLAEEAIKLSNESLQAEVNERKQFEAALKQSNRSLQAEIEVRKQAEVRLAASLTEKELLLKEIHHRVKNNLQIISSLLSLQTSSTANEHASSILKESQNRIKSMALIHEKLYGSRDLARIDFRGYVQSLIAFLTRSYVLYPVPTIEVDIEDVSLDIDMAIPCGLIINELISNSLKYAFKDEPAGAIRVALAREGNLYRLEISDNGIGIPPEVDFRNSTSLGLQLVVTLTDQLNGSLEHLDGKGTTFVITFMENSPKNI